MPKKEFRIAAPRVMRPEPATASEPQTSSPAYLARQLRNELIVHRAAIQQRVAAIADLTLSALTAEHQAERAAQHSRRAPQRPPGMSGRGEPGWLTPEAEGDPPWLDLSGEFAQAAAAVKPVEAVVTAIASVRRRQTALDMRTRVTAAKANAKKFASAANALCRSIAGMGDGVEVAPASVGRITSIPMPLWDRANAATAPLLRLAQGVAGYLALLADVTVDSLNGIERRLDPKSRGAVDIGLRKLAVLALDAAGVSHDEIAGVLRREFEDVAKPYTTAKLKQQWIDKLLCDEDERTFFLRALEWAKETEVPDGLEDNLGEAHCSRDEDGFAVRASIDARRKHFEILIERCKNRPTDGRGRRKRR